ncbi:MAG: AzlD domain-containing protein [Clostridia bacterium]|nr:AzlD domain-containing protein [Clostridia bacterium]
MSVNILVAILLMAGITYLIRVLPLVLIRREIKNPIIRSFLHYVPYVTLSVMTFPAILSATTVIWSALAALIVAVLLSLKGCKLPIVAAAACVTVFLVELIPF